jgi:hypothetical protein
LSNDTGIFNTVAGALALRDNTTGDVNVATGQQALFSNTEGSRNTATGASALFANTMGDDNTAIGFSALHDNTGSANIALGSGAGGALTTGNRNIDIGNVGVAGDANTMRIGGSTQFRTFIEGIRGRTTGINDAVPVLIDSAGQLGTTSSSRRFKKDIKPMDQTSETILALKPVTFHYKSDSTAVPQFGLIAEEVAQVNPNLVVRDAGGEIYTVRYEAVNAMLLNEFLKEHKAFVQEQRKVQELEQRIEKLAADLQKVTTQIQLSNPAAQMAANQK